MRKALIATLLLPILMFCTACSAGWVSTLDSILAVAAPALVNILEITALAKGQEVNAAEVSKINQDTAAIRTLAADFAQASSLAAPGVCSQLQASIATYQADQQLVLATAQVSDANTQTKIALLSNLVAGTVDAILGLIPSCEAAQPAAMRATAPASLKMFVDSYNKILTAGTGNAAVDGLTPKLKLHQQARVLRALTFGRWQ